jgi:hypothetical protein
MAAEASVPHPSPRRGVPTAVYRREAEALAAELKRYIAGEVRFDAGSRALCATDFSIYRQVPIGVVIPKHAEDVEASKAGPSGNDHRTDIIGTRSAPCTAGSRRIGRW